MTVAELAYRLSECHPDAAVRINDGNQLISFTERCVLGGRNDKQVTIDITDAECTTYHYSDDE